MKKIVGFVIAWAVAFALVGWGAASAQAADSYQLANTQAQSITAHGSCAVITNSTGKTLFVPTRTPEEWTAFKDHPPLNVSVSGSCGCAASGACGVSSDGAVCTSYSATSVSYPSACSSVARSSTCSGGSWSVAPYSYGSCSVAYSYSWNYAGWGSCSASCGSGSQSRTVWCERNDGASVSDSYCSGAGTKPSISTSCSDYSGCSYSWDYSGWGSCSASCGSGSQSRTVWCERSDGTSVSDSYCSGAGTKPTASGSCSDYSGCSYSWNYGSWGSCSASCGGGSQSRSVWCQRSDGSSVSDSYCGGGKPSTSQSCNTQSCYSYDWAADGWSSCSAQCAGTQTRNVWCRRSDGASVSTSYCFGIPPSSSQSCNGNGTSCSTCSGAGCNYGTCSGSSCSALSPYYCWSSPGGCSYGSTAGSPAGQNICQASDPSYYGQSCTIGTSAANECGQTQACTGTRDCANNCVGSCSPPPNTCTFSWEPATCPSTWYGSSQSCGYSPYYGNYFMYYKYFTFNCTRSTDGAVVSSSLCGASPASSVCEAKCDYHN